MTIEKNTTLNDYLNDIKSNNIVGIFDDGSIKIYDSIQDVFEYDDRYYLWRNNLRLDGDNRALFREFRDGTTLYQQSVLINHNKAKTLTQNIIDHYTQSVGYLFDGLGW